MAQPPNRLRLLCYVMGAAHCLASYGRTTRLTTTSARLRNLSNTSIKFAGPVSYSDANALGREMYSSGEFLRSMKATSTETQFAVHVKTITSSAIRLTIPFGTMEAAPRMPAADHDAIRQRNRQQVGIEHFASAGSTNPSHTCALSSGAIASH
jgi:hypothetical protein